MTSRTAAALVLMVMAALATPAGAMAATCPPEVTGQLKIGAEHEFVSTRTDNGFGAEVIAPSGSVNDESIKVTAQPPAVVKELETGGRRLEAPDAGPVTLTATWEQQPVTGPTCSASAQAVVTVVPVRLPVVRLETHDTPAAVGPTLTWPCPNAERVTDAASTIVVRYEKGLKRAPGPSSPSLRLQLADPCERNLHRGTSKGGISLGASNEYAFDPTRYGTVLHATAGRDLRLAIEISWGAHPALRGDYAMVYAGRRPLDRKAVFMVTSPGRAAAVARRYARQRAGRPFRSPDQLDVRRGRNYTLKVSGSYNVSWTAGRGVPGEPGCGFVRESGSETAKFNVSGETNLIRGSADRTYVPTTECVPSPRIGINQGCEPHVTLSGQGTAEFLSSGATMWTGKRAPGPRLMLMLFLDRESCPGWEGIFSNPALFLDGPAARVFKLRVGRRTTVRVTQKSACVDQVAATQGDPASCQLSATANVVVRRTS